MEKLELPEVETLRRDLDREFGGRKVKSADALMLKAMPTHKTRKSFEEAMVGAKVVAVERVGLHLVIHLDNEHALAISLAPTGRVVKAAGKEPAETGTIAAISFTQGGDLRIVDPEGESTVDLVADTDLPSVLPGPDELGLDLHEKPVSWVDFGRIVRAEKAPLKLLLTDPSVFVGIGDIYSNEILFDAGLRHDRPGESLSTQEIRRLYRSVVGILHEAIKYGGTSLGSRPFADLSGKPGEYAEHLAVYGKAGELSPRSRAPIQKTSFRHRVVYYCNTQV
ncbi:MAG: Fpg/Nei family DNA glycosylase [Acidimicrobiales bacterium]